MSITYLMFSYQGRIGRLAWWGGGLLQLILVTMLFSAVFSISGVNIGVFLAYCIIAPVTLLFGMGLPPVPAETDAAAFSLALTLLPFALAISMWTGLALNTKRWHDRDKSGWWQLITFIPYVGLLWFAIELGFLAGTASTNRFGPRGGSPQGSGSNWRDGPDSGVDADAIIARYKNRPVPDVPLVAPAALARRQAASAQHSGFGRRGLR